MAGSYPCWKRVPSNKRRRRRRSDLVRVPCARGSRHMERTMSEQTASQTQTETISETVATDSGSQDVPTVRLRLRKPKSNKKVQWTQGTVDNENLNKKKSKCCCIYEKPKTFGESSSEDSDDECEHCHGHKDAHKKILPNPGDPAREGMSSHPEPIATGST